MKGHGELKSHPFFEGIDWMMLKQHKVQVPAYNVMRDPENLGIIKSFSLYDPDDIRMSEN